VKSPVKTKSPDRNRSQTILRTNCETQAYPRSGFGSYLSEPLHPAIAALAGTRWLVAFGSTEGIVAAIFRKDR
jgi:hypothetical protein